MGGTWAYVCLADEHRNFNPVYISSTKAKETNQVTLKYAKKKLPSHPTRESRKRVPGSERHRAADPLPRPILGVLKWE